MPKKERTLTEEQQESVALVERTWNHSIVPEVTTPLHRCPTNLNLDTEIGKALAVNSTGTPDVTVPEGGRIEFKAHYYLLHKVERLNEDTGQLEEWPRLVLFNQDGETLVTTGVMVPDQFRAILSMYPPERWRDGITLTILSKPNRSGKGSHHELRVKLA